jgi:hypothetical protein
MKKELDPCKISFLPRTVQHHGSGSLANKKGTTAC